MSVKQFWAALVGLAGGGGNTGGGIGGPGTPGSITIQADVAGDPYGNAENPGPYPTFEFLINGVVVYGPVDVTADRNGSPGSQTLTFTVPYSRGAVVTAGVRFSNDWASNPYTTDTDRNLIVDEVRIDTTSGSPVTIQPIYGTFVLTTPRPGGQTAVASDGVIFENGTLTWDDVGELLGNGELEVVLSGRPTAGDSTNSGPDPNFEWLINGTATGTGGTITAVTGTGTQTFTYSHVGPTITSFGVRFSNYHNAGGSIGPREMTVHSGKIGDQVLAIDSAFRRTIVNSPDDYVDYGPATNGLLWRPGDGEWKLDGQWATDPGTGGGGGESSGGGSSGGGGTGTETGRALTRAGTQLLFRGDPVRIYGPNFNPWASTGSTWTQAEQNASIAELTTIKSVWTANCVRFVISPGVYRYWNAPSRNRFWPWMHALMTECARLEMFAIIDWWTVAQPGGGKADDSWGGFYLPNFYSPSVSEADAWWLRAAQELKQYEWAIFHLWDEPFGSWQSVRDYVQAWIYTIRNQGARNVISLPGGNYNQDFRGLGTYTVTDTLSPPQFTIGTNQFQSEPHNYAFYHNDSVLGNLDLLFPVIIGGFGWPPDDGSLTTPGGSNAADMISWLATVPPAAEGICPWKHSRFSTPRALRLDQPGWPDKNVMPTLSNMGAAMKALRPSTLVYNTAGTTPTPAPSPTGQPAKITSIPNVVDLSGSAAWFFDPSAGSNGSGNSAASPFNSWGSFLAAWQPGQTVAMRRGTTYNADGNSQFAMDIAGKGGSTFGCYGASGARPIIKNVKTYTTGITNVSGNVYKRAIGAMPATTGYAALSVTHATNCIVNGTHWCSWRARNGAGEVGAKSDMLYHTNGDLTFNAGGLTPTTLEVPWQTVMRLSNCAGLRLQDLDIGHSRDHGIIVGEVGDVIIRRCVIRRCGLSGIYWQNKRNQVTYDCIIEDNELTEIHAEGVVLNWPGDVRNAFRRTKVRRNKLHKCCMGPPFIFSGTTSQDYYSGAVKIFTQSWEPATWWNDIEIYDNHVHDIGNIGTPYVYSGNYRYDGVSGYESNQAMAFWPDTVTGHPALGGVRIYNNWVENCWAAGAFIENCPDGGHQVYENLFINCGTDLSGWSGGVCIGRGSRQQLVHKNTIRSCKNGGIVFQAGGGTTVTGDKRSFSEGVRDNVARDNIVSQTANWPVIIDRSRDGGASNNINKNLLHGGPYLHHPNQPWSNPTAYATAQAYGNARGGGVTGTIEADPQFTNPASGDFSLQSGSPAKNAATDGGNMGAV
jgi:hypothetical protein